MTSQTIGAPEAEAALIGSLLFMGSRSAGLVLLDLHEADLVDPRHRAVLGAVRAVVEAGVRPDAVTVLGELRRTAALSASTDRSAGTYLSDLIASVPVPESAGYYGRIVKEHAARRRMGEAGERLAQAAATSPMDDLHPLLVAEGKAVVDALRRAEAVQ